MDVWSLGGLCYAMLAGRFSNTYVAFAAAGSGACLAARVPCGERMHSRVSQDLAPHETAVARQRTVWTICAIDRKEIKKRRKARKRTARKVQQDLALQTEVSENVQRFRRLRNNSPGPLEVQDGGGARGAPERDAAELRRRRLGGEPRGAQLLQRRFYGNLATSPYR